MIRTDQRGFRMNRTGKQKTILELTVDKSETNRYIDVVIGR